MSKVWKQNLKSESFWLRSLFMLLFLVVYRIVDLVVLLVAICQWWFVLITGDANTELTKFAASLARYVEQMVAYLGYHSDEKPFPFSDWPEASQAKTENPTSEEPHSEAQRLTEQSDDSNGRLRD